MGDVRDLMRLDNRVAIITGGARGIGQETAETLAVAGARVVVADLDKDVAAAAAAEMIPASSSFGRACRLRRLLRLRPASTADQGSFWRAYEGVGSSGRRIRDPIGRAAILDPFADDRVAAIAQTCDRRARGVRQPAGRGGQIANGRPLVSPQHGDDRGQLAALPRRGVIGMLEPGSRVDGARRLYNRFGRRRFLVDRDGLQSGRRQLQSQGLAAFTIATPDRRSRFRLDLPYKFRCDQFGCDFLRCAVLQSWRRRKAAVIALRGSPHHRELSVGKLDGHDFTLRIVKGPANPGPSLTRAPDRKRSPRRRDCKAAHAPHVDTHALFRGERQSFLGARVRSVTDVFVPCMSSKCPT